MAQTVRFVIHRVAGLVHSQGAARESVRGPPVCTPQTEPGIIEWIGISGAGRRPACR